MSSSVGDNEHHFPSLFEAENLTDLFFAVSPLVRNFPPFVKGLRAGVAGAGVVEFEQAFFPPPWSGV